MKTTVIAATIALGLTAGAALADQPMVLTNAQLDQVTGGPTMVEYALQLVAIAGMEVEFTAAARAGQNDAFLGAHSEGGFKFDPDSGIWFKAMPPGGSVGVRP